MCTHTHCSGSRVVHFTFSGDDDIIIHINMMCEESDVFKQ